MIIDIFSRKIVGYEVWKEENAEHAQTLIRKAMHVYEIARQNHPERWTTTIRKWDLSDTVALNPAKEKEHDMAKKKANQTSI